MAKFKCFVCGYIFDEAQAGIQFSEITECPICAESRDIFRRLDDEEEAGKDSEKKEEASEEKKEDASEKKAEEVAEEKKASEKEGEEAKKEEPKDEPKEEPAKEDSEKKEEPKDEAAEKKDEKADEFAAKGFVIEKRQEFWLDEKGKENGEVDKSHIQTYYDGGIPVKSPEEIEREKKRLEEENRPRLDPIDGSGSVKKVIDGGDRSSDGSDSEVVVVDEENKATSDVDAGDDDFVFEEAVIESTEPLETEEIPAAVSAGIIEEGDFFTGFDSNPNFGDTVRTEEFIFDDEEPVGEAVEIEEILSEEAAEVVEAVPVEEVAEAEEIVTEVAEETTEEVAETLEEVVEEVAEEAAPVEEAVEEAAPVEEAAEEVTEQPAEETPEVVEEILFEDEEIAEEVAPVEEAVEEVAEEAAPAEEAIEEVVETAEETTEEVAEAVEETTGEVVEEAASAEEAVEEAAEEVVSAEESVEEVAEEATETIEETVEETAEEIAEETAPVEETAEEVEEKSAIPVAAGVGAAAAAAFVAAVAADSKDETSEEATEEVAEVEETVAESVEEATEEVAEETAEEITEEVTEEVAEVAEEAVEESTEEVNEEVAEVAEETTEEVAETTEETVEEAAEEATETIEEAAEEAAEEAVTETTENVEESAEPAEVIGTAVVEAKKYSLLAEEQVNLFEKYGQGVVNNGLEGIILLPAQLNPLPMSRDENIHAGTTIGKFAEKPAKLAEPFGNSSLFTWGEFIPGESVSDNLEDASLVLIKGKNSHIPNVSGKEQLRMEVSDARLLSGGRPVGISLMIGRIEQDLAACVYADMDYVVLSDLSTGMLPYALRRAKNYLARVNSGLEIIVSIKDVNNAQEIAKLLALGADFILLERECDESRISRMKASVKEIARNTGHGNVHELNMYDICTIDSNLAANTDISHF